MRARAIAFMTIGLALTACETAQDVRILPLPSEERQSPEARLGLPAIGGNWRFAGWEVLRGDTAALERTFPSFGDLILHTQRLDSLAGSFALQGVEVPMVGEVRRDGRVALVTFRDGAPGEFVAGHLVRDTLWLELGSVLPADEWPRDARAAFVKEPTREPLAWLRGALPEPGFPEVPVDSDGLQPRESAPFDSPSRPPGAPAPPISPPSAPPPTPAEPPARAQPAAPAVEPPAPPPARPPPPPPEPEPEPEPDFPPLLGEPVIRN